MDGQLIMNWQLGLEYTPKLLRKSQVILKFTIDFRTYSGL